jgi:hypothetical protein
MTFVNKKTNDNDEKRLLWATKHVMVDPHISKCPKTLHINAHLN